MFILSSVFCHSSPFRSHLARGLVSLKLLHTFQCQHVVCGVEQQRKTRCVGVFEFIETKSEFILTSVSSESTEGKNPP